MFGSLTLTHKAIAFMGLLALLHSGGVLANYMFERREAEADRHVDASMTGELLLELSAKDVYAVTVDSRGIYASSTSGEAKPYVTDLMLHLGDLSAIVKQLPTAGAENEAAAIASATTHIDDFIRFRVELARLAQQIDVAAARSFGENDAVRRNQEDLTAELEGLAARYAKYSETSVAPAHLWRDRTETVAAISAALLLAAMALGVLLLAHGFTRPVERLKSSILALAQGDLEVEIYGVLRKDLIGGVAKAVVALREGIVAKRRLECEAVEQQARLDEERGKAEIKSREDEEEHSVLIDALAGGLVKLADRDLTARIEVDFGGDFQEIKTDFNDAMACIEEAMAAVIDAAKVIMAGSQQIATASGDLSRGTELQASNFQETTAAVAEITEAIQRTAESTKQARDVVTGSRSEAEASSEIARQTVEAMRKIEKSSKEIGDIIGVIDEIAFQTNLLALNAGVEAARAGDSGRGFAVVASEVRALAQRSAEAAKQIKRLIATSSGEVGNGVKLVAASSELLTRIVAKVSEIDAVVAEIATSAMGQALGLQAVSTAVGKMNEVMTKQNAAVGDQVTAASQLLVREIEQLSELLGQFRHSSDDSAIQAAQAA